MEKEGPAAVERHRRTPRPENASEPEDPVEKLLNKTGCLELHYKVQDCIADGADWRKCQKEVEDFRLCIEASKKREPKRQ